MNFDMEEARRELRQIYAFLDEAMKETVASERYAPALHLMMTSAVSDLEVRLAVKFLGLDAVMGGMMVAAFLAGRKAERAGLVHLMSDPMPGSADRAQQWADMMRRGDLGG